jgi:GT2 family glycosyltransferase
MSFQKEPNLTIIILSYNSSHIIENCLNKLDFEKYKIVVVDNASSDNSAEFIRQKFPKAQLIEMSKNVGYGRGNNEALKLVKTEFALVLNPDAIISDSDIEIVLNEMRADEKVAMAGPIILEQDSITQEAIDKELAKISKDLSGIRDTYYCKSGNGYSSKFIIGACVFFRVSIFQKIGFFDENFFMFYEDDELCLRVIRNGYKNLIVPQAVACHVGGLSSKKSLRNTYRRNWHLKGWSKLHWKEVRKGKFAAKKSAIRLTSSYFVKSLISLVRLDLEGLAINFSAFNSSFLFLFGVSAFKKDGTGKG